MSDAKAPGRIAKTKGFFAGVMGELKKVNWLSKHELIKYTTLVILVVAVMAVIISVFDFGVSSILSALL